MKKKIKWYVDGMDDINSKNEVVLKVLYIHMQK